MTRHIHVWTGISFYLHVCALDLDLHLQVCLWCALMSMHMSVLKLVSPCLAIFRFLPLPAYRRCGSEGNDTQAGSGTVVGKVRGFRDPTPARWVM